MPSSFDALTSLAQGPPGFGMIGSVSLPWGSEGGGGDPSGVIVRIGQDVYEFVNTENSSTVSDDANIAVMVDGYADCFAVSEGPFMEAINGVAPVNHPTITLLDGVTPAKGRGTENVFAFVYNVVFTILPAPSPGFNMLRCDISAWDSLPLTPPDLALETTTTPWSHDNMDKVLWVHPKSKLPLLFFKERVRADNMYPMRWYIFSAGVPNLIYLVQGYDGSGMTIMDQSGNWTVRWFQSDLQSMYLPVTDPDAHVAVFEGVMDMAVENDWIHFLCGEMSWIPNASPPE